MFAPETDIVVFSENEILPDFTLEDLDRLLNDPMENYNNTSPSYSYGSPSSSGSESVSICMPSPSPVYDSDIDCFCESLEVSPASYIYNCYSDESGITTNSPSYSNSQYGSPASSSFEYFTQNSIKQEAEVPRVKGPTKTKKRVPQNMKACKHIWQFLRDLLKDPEYRTWITWLDAKRGIFKILKPDETAISWRHYKSQDRRRDFTEDDLDEKNNKKKYPNMARGIRYSRDCGYFETISKSEMRDFGKKLVYKFSKTTTAHCAWLRSIMTD